MFNERITVYWLIAAVILVVLEMFVGTFYLLVIAAALASVGLTEWLFATGMEFNLALLGVLCLGGCTGQAAQDTFI